MHDHLQQQHSREAEDSVPGMFPVLVVRVTLPGVYSGGEDDDAGSGTAEGDDAGSNRMSASTRDPFQMQSSLA